MALPPGFLKFDGSKWVIDEDIEGQDGEPGPPGPPGAGAFIFRPGGTQENNVYTSWSDLMAARAEVDGPATIVIDDSIASAEISEGVWQLNRNTAIVGYRGYEDTSTSGVMATLTISGDAQLVNPSDFENIRIIGSSSGGASFINGGDFLTMNIIARNSFFSTTGAQPLFQSSSSYADYHTFELYGESSILKTSDTPVIDASNGVNEIHLYDSSNVDGYTLQTQSFGTLVFKVYSLGATYDSFQPQASSLTVENYVGLPPTIIPLFAGLATTTSDVYVRVTSCYLDLSIYPETLMSLTREVYFKANIGGEGCGGAVVSVRLYNYTDGESVTDTELTAPGENAGEITEVSAGPLTVDSSAGNLKDYPAQYDVQIHDDSGVSVSAEITNARLEIRYV